MAVGRDIVLQRIELVENDPAICELLLVGADRKAYGECLAHLLLARGTLDSSVEFSLRVVVARPFSPGYNSAVR